MKNIDEMNFQDDLFNLFKEDVNTLITNNWTSVDKEIIPHLAMFNEIPNVVTRFSCASHPENNNNRFYVMFLHNAETALFLDKLLDKMYHANTTLTHIVDYSVYTNYSLLTRCNKSVNYKTIFIEARLDQVTKPVFLKELLEAMISIKPHH